MSVNGPLTLVAPPGTSRPPVIEPAILADNSSPMTAFEIAGGPLTIKNIYFFGVRPDGQLLNWSLALNINANGVAITIDHCIFDGWTFAAIQYYGGRDVLRITNSIFRNLIHPTAPFGGNAMRGSPGVQDINDTLVMTNNTMFCTNGYAFCPIVPAGYTLFDHNTIFLTVVNPLYDLFATNAIFINNIFYGTFAGEQARKEIAGGWYDDPPDGSSTFSFDSLSAPYSQGYPPGVTEEERKISVQDNNCYWPQSMTDFWNSALMDTLVPPVFMNARTRMMFADKSRWPNLVEANNDSLDPGFDTSVTNQVNDLFKYVTLLRTNQQPNYVWSYDPDGESPNVVQWPLPENLAYTSAAVLQDGINGFPLGDLNWFPSQLAAWKAKGGASADVAGLVGPTSALSPPVPSSPSDMSNGVSTNPVFTWMASAGAWSYELQISTDSTFANLVRDTSGVISTSLAIQGLSKETTYYWRVNASNSGDTSPWSKVWHFTTGSGAVAVPTTNVALSSNGGIATAISEGTYVGITHYASLAIDGDTSTAWADAGEMPAWLVVKFDSLYKIGTVGVWWGSHQQRFSISLSSDSSNWTTVVGPELSDNSEGSAPVHQLFAVSPMNARFIKLYIDSTSAPATHMFQAMVAELEAFQANAVPVVPTLISPEDKATGVASNVSFSWNASANATSYRLQISEDSTFTSTRYDASALTATSFQASGLADSTTYFWRVNASDSAGTSPWSDVWHFTTAPPQTVPTAPKLVGPTGTSVITNPVLSWEDSSGNGVTYSLDVSQYQNFSPAVFDSSGITSLSQRVTNLATSTTYYWRVKASNQAGSSNWSTSSFSTFSYPSVIHVFLNFMPPGTNDISNYRIVGIPGQVDLPVSSQLLGNEGSDWEVYWDNGAPDNYQMKYDGSSTFDFLPGRAFWIFTDSPFTVQQNESSVPLNTGDCYPIPVHSGWNLISDPFEKSVPWSWVQDLYARIYPIQPIHSFNGVYDTSSSFDPYTGYYFYNDDNLSSLSIPYVYNSGASVSTKAPPNKVSSVDNRIVKLTLSCGQGKTLSAEVGFNQTVQDTLNRLDIFAPPGNFDNLRINVVDPNVAGYWKQMSSDFRNQIGKGQSFDIEVKNLTGHPSLITPELTAGFENYGVYLVDNGTRSFYNLKSVDSISISNTYKYKSFTLLVGDENYIDSVRTALAPKSFSLFQNYPNPFNPATTIRYEIPKRSAVAVKVYNVLGELVRTLVDEVQQAGYYEVDFNGAGLASGVYFCRIEAGSFSQVKKMVLLK